jgi:dTDP-4-dehydrorhamnose reductase
VGSPGDGAGLTRVLIVGGAGMLGHKLAQRFAGKFDTWVTLRSGARDYAKYGFVDPSRVIEGVDAHSFDSVVRAVAAVKPNVIVNCIGIIKQLPTAQDPLISIEGNSLFPHRLANVGRAAGARTIHISTDCVFSGRKGMYTEADQSDAEDLYGRSKFLGEIGGEGALTLRTSIIGRELRSTSGLVEWFLSQRGRKIQGWMRAIYTGFTTDALAEIIGRVIALHPELSGTWQVSSEPITKYDLLHLLRDAYATGQEIEPNDAVFIDRSLDSTRFRGATGFAPPSWPEMIRQMAADPTPYDSWRNERAS